MNVIGSEEPLSTGWLCCLLALLYQTSAGNSRIFNSVIVVTKKGALNKQIRNSIKQMKQTKEVVSPVEGTLQQLKTCLQAEKSIIVTTMRKFPVISKSIAQIKDRRFAIVISEAHSSKSDKTNRHPKNSNSKAELDEYQVDEGNEALTTVGKLIMDEICLRGKQQHISYFGFNGSSKHKALELFEARNEDGNFESYSFISMKQKYIGRIYVGNSSILLYP